MELKTYYRELSPAERKQYADRAGTETEYIRIHLIPPNNPPDRMPRKDLLRSLAEASEGNVSLGEVLEHFLGYEAVA